MIRRRKPRRPKNWELTLLRFYVTNKGDEILVTGQLVDLAENRPETEAMVDLCAKGIRAELAVAELIGGDLTKTN